MKRHASPFRTLRRLWFPAALLLLLAVAGALLLLPPPAAQAQTPSTDAVDLSGLTTDIGALSPAFAPDTTGYAIDLAAADSEIIVRPVTADAAATVSYVDGANAAIADADSAADGYQIPLAFGENTVKVRVAKGSESQDYTLTVTRAAQPAVIAYMKGLNALVYWKDPVAAGCPDTDTADTTDDDYKVYLEFVAGTWNENLTFVNTAYTPAGVLVKPAGYLSRYFTFSQLIASAGAEVWCGTRNGAGSRKVGGDIADYVHNQPATVTLSDTTSFTPNDQNFAGISGVPSSGYNRYISEYRATVAHDAVHTTVTATKHGFNAGFPTRLYDSAGAQLSDADPDAPGFQVAIAETGETFFRLETKKNHNIQLFFVNKTFRITRAAPPGTVYAHHVGDHLFPSTFNLRLRVEWTDNHPDACGAGYKVRVYAKLNNALWGTSAAQHANPGSWEFYNSGFIGVYDRADVWCGEPGTGRKVGQSTTVIHSTAYVGSLALASAADSPVTFSFTPPFTHKTLEYAVDHTDGAVADAVLTLQSNRVPVTVRAYTADTDGDGDIDSDDAGTAVPRTSRTLGTIGNAGIATETYRLNGLAVGANLVTVESVYTHSGVSSAATYTLTVSRQISTEATLSGIAYTNADTDAAIEVADSLSAGVIELPEDAAKVTVAPQTTHGGASYSITAPSDGDTVAEGFQLLLDPAETKTVTIVVTPEDATASTRSYTVRLKRAAAGTPKLETLSVANAADGAALGLTPVFAADTTDYSASPAYAVSLVTVTATAEAGTTVAFEDGVGAALTDAAAATGFQAALVPGENVIKVKVTKSGASASYTITLTRAKPQVSIAAVTASPAAEGAALVFRVSRSAAAGDTLAVTVSVGEDGAMVDDALEMASTVTIAANQTGADLTVQTDAIDAVWEEHSTVTARTEAGDLYVQAQPAMARILVRDDDFPAATASLSVADTVAEDAGKLSFELLVVTHGDTQPHRAVDLNVVSRSGTAASPGDFAAAGHQLHFPVSSFERQTYGVWAVAISASITIVDDAVHEPDEQFTLRVEGTPTRPAALALPTDPSTVTILDDDTPMLLASNVRQGPVVSHWAAGTEVGQGFTTGAAEDGYTLGSVGLYLPSGSAALTVSLRAADGDNPSANVLHALTNPQTFVIGTNYFAAPADTVLARDTTYFVVVSGSAAFELGTDASDDEDSGGAAGWSIADRARAAQAGAWGQLSYDSNLAISVRGEEAASTDATLSALSLSAGTLKPAFAAGTISYTAEVPNSVSSVTVTATKSHPDATAPVIKLGGTVDADGAVALAVGANVITVEVTAEDGATTETYTVTVTRAAAAESTGTAGSSISVVIETITSGKRVAVSWTDGGTCATTSSYNVYMYLALIDSTLAAGITVTPVAGTSSYSKSKDFTSFGVDEVSIWCGTPASGRLVAKVDGLNVGTAGTYAHSVPAAAVTEVNAELSVAQPSGYTLGVTWSDASACDDDYSIYTNIVGSPGAGTLRGAVDGVPPEFYSYYPSVASGGLTVSVWCGDSATGRELGSADVDPGEADDAVAVATADRGSGLVQISRSDEPQIAASGAFEVRFVFANGVGPDGSAVSATEFQLADIRVVNGAASGLEQAHKNPDFPGVIWKATITPATLGESVLVHLPAGSVMGGPDQDHPNKAGSLHVGTATDTTAPVVTLRLYDASPCRVTRARNFAVIFDDPMNDADPLAATDFTVTNGQVVALRDVYISENGRDWQRATVVTVVPQVMSRQTVSVALKAGAVANKAGLTNAAASLTFQADPDNCPPRVSWVGISKQTETTWWVSFYFNEPVLGFAHTDVTLGEFASWLQTDHYGLWNEAHSNRHNFLLEHAAANSLELSVAAGAFNDGNNDNSGVFRHTFTPPLAEPPLFKPPLRTWLRDRPDGMAGRQLVVTWQDDSCTTTYQVAQFLNNAWAVLGSGTDLAAPATQYITHNFESAESSKLVRLVCGTTAQAASGAQQIVPLAQATAQYRAPASAQQGASPAPAAPRAAVGIADAALRSALEAALDKEAGAPITPQELAGLTRLDLRGTGVADLTGLEHAVNLAELHLDGLDMDLAPLDGLTVVVYVSPPPLPDPPSSSDDATLSGLALSGAALASAFDPAATAYDASVANDVAETTVTPTVNDDGATYVIKLDGVADADGTVFLSVGENVISVVVTAEDGKTVKTYTVTVTRAAPPAPGPMVTIALSPSGAVEPGTAITVTMSFANLEFDSERATRDYIFRADVLDSDNGDADGCEDRKNGYGLGVERYMWQVDQDPEVRRGATSAGCPAGDYTVRAMIASPDNVELASASAGFSVVEPEPTLSGDATLDSLALSGAALAFDPAATAYTAEVANDVSETTVTATTNHDGASYAIKLDGVADADGTVGLAVGANTISIVVTAEDGETTRTYTVTVTRAAPPLSTDATLRSLTLSGVTLAPAFGADTTRYTAQVANDVTETTATPVVNDDGATYVVQLDGADDADGVIPLSVGENVVSIVVTAEDGETAITYTVTVTRAAPPLSTDAMLDSLSLSSVGALAFDPAVTGYAAQVANDVTETTVTPAVNQDGATYVIKLDGVTDADGVIPLSVGTNAISIVVTAEDGETTRSYTVTVTRAAPPSDDATLSGLTLSGLTLNFDPATTAYAAQVANGVAETAVTPSTNHEGATYTVQLDGVSDADGTVDLAVGENVITIEVTAEDGETARTYTVTVTRAEPPSDDATLSGLALSGVTLAFDPATDSYDVSVAHDVEQTTVTATPNHDGAAYAVQLDGVADADGTVDLAMGENVISIVVTAEDGETARTYSVTVTRAAAAPEPTPEQTKPFIEVHFPGGPALTQGEETGVEIRFHNLELGRNVKHRFWADIVDNSGNAASACEGRGLGQTRNMSHVDENPEVRTAIISAACPAGEYEIKVFIIDSNGGGIARTAVQFRVE